MNSAKAPVSGSSVVSSTGTIPGREMSATRVRSGSFGPFSPAGSMVKIAAAEASPTTAMVEKVPRQPQKPAMSAPSGAPKATAMVVPPTITDIARAR